MLRRALRSIPRVAKQQRAQSAFNPKNFHVEEGRLTTQQVITFIDSRLGDINLNYKAKNTAPVEELIASAQAQVERPFYYDQKFIDWAAHTFGYDKQEILVAINGKYPKFVEGEKIHWDNVKAFLGETENEKTKWGEIEGMAAVFEDATQELERNAVSIDWSKYTPLVGEEAINELKAQYEYAIANFLPEVDATQVNARLAQYFTAMSDQLKDQAAQTIPRIKELTDQIAHESVFIRRDADLVQYGTPAYLDKFMPGVRDEMIQEIEEGEWDYEYKGEFKKLPSSEDFLSLSKKKEREELARAEEAFAKDSEATTASDLSPKAKKLADLVLSLKNKAEANRALESEVNQLKAAHEFQEEKEDKKEEKVSKMIGEKEWFDMLLKQFNVNREVKPTRDFVPSTQKKVSH